MEVAGCLLVFAVGAVETAANCERTPIGSKSFRLSEVEERRHRRRRKLDASRRDWNAKVQDRVNALS